MNAEYTPIRNIVKQVLDKYSDTQANLDSTTLKDMIADEITDELIYYNPDVSEYIDDDLSV